MGTLKTVAKILDGHALGDKIQQQIKIAVDARVAAGHRPPRLDVLLVGEDPASAIYVERKAAACRAVGIYSVLHRFKRSITATALGEQITELNNQETVDGILLQLPLPSAMGDTSWLLEQINPSKDVDGFHPYNLGRLLQRKPFLRPCTPYGIIQLLNHAAIDCNGRHAVIVSASNIVGRPLSMELLLKKATTTVCHRFTTHLEAYVRQADILISATGKPGIISTNWIKPGSIVIDVGIHRTTTGKIAGDMDFDSAKNVASWITPVPGGVGPMTIATLLQNTMHAYVHHLNATHSGTAPVTSKPNNNSAS